jgi:CDP-glucose 4,6-dehydratase
VEIGAGSLEVVDVNRRRIPDGSFWRGKRVVLTGHTGFKGAWTALWLDRLGAGVTGIALEPDCRPNLYELAGVASMVSSHICDIRNREAVAEIMRRARPEIVLHLAAQALVRAGYRDPVETFATNVMGTVNVLDAIRGVPSVRVVLAVTSDKVYRNLEHPYPYREDDALGGRDPYSASKSAAEIIIASYRDSYLAAQGAAVASVRAGNVIGGGDWSEDRLIPDAVRAWSAQSTLQVRRPDAIRPWQHVLEPLNGYLTLAEEVWRMPARAGAYNFGPETHEAATVRRVIELARDAYGRGDVSWGDGSDGPHEAGWLALEISKSRSMLGVVPRWNLVESVTRTMDWYRRLVAGERAAALCELDIAAFEAAA